MTEAPRLNCWVLLIEFQINASKQLLEIVRKYFRLNFRRGRSWLNAFTLWSNQIRREMLEKDPTTIFPPDLSSKLRLQWKAMSAAQRNPYYSEAYNMHG